MANLNENHKRRLEITFQHVDQLLSEAEQVLRIGSSKSPFKRYIPDENPLQTKVLHDYIVWLQEEMVRSLQHLDIDISSPTIGALKAFGTSVLFADIALEEIKPGYMCGYGFLSDEDSRELERMSCDLQRVLKQMSDYLNLQSAASIGERLTGNTDEVRLLRDIERVITDRGLVEFRGMLGMLAERLETRNYEIAVFGKVNAGKSTLLNYVLQSEVLPVGVTPITAVPTRITYGKEPCLIVAFAEGKPEQHEVSELAEFCTEQSNPDNSKHVSFLRVELPVDWLQGVTLIDTPGVGSLAGSGQAETMAFLPRCDLGLVLLGASFTLTEEDLSLIGMLRDSRAGIMVLVSKADLLNAQERKQVMEYVRKQLSDHGGFTSDVHLVSSRGNAVDMAERWFIETFLPLIREHEKHANASLRRKVEALRDAVVASLQNRVDRGPARLPEETEETRRKADLALRETAFLFAQASRESEKTLDALDDAAACVLWEFASAIAEGWLRRQTPDPSAVFQQLLSRRLSDIAIRISSLLNELTGRLNSVLRLAANIASAIPDTELPVPSDLPILDPSSIAARLHLKRPRFSFLGKRMMQHAILTQTKDQLEVVLREIIRLYRRQLSKWMQNRLDQLQRTFHSKADVLRAQMRRSGAETMDPLEREDIDRNIHLLSKDSSIAGESNEPTTAPTTAKRTVDSPGTRS
jgi:small GTP-binding protein